jgi:CBS domain-containing protein
MKASDIMTANPVSVEPSSSVMQAVRLMLQHRISGLPVVAASGTLVGVITEGDLLRRTEKVLRRGGRDGSNFLSVQKN